MIALPDLTIHGHPEVFVTGDIAAAKSADTGKPVPGVAQGGIQMGRYAGQMIAREVREGRSPHDRPAFAYWDKGSMAVLGKAKAVAEVGGWKFGGFPAWAMWGGIHILFLVGLRNRLQVLLAWFWNWMLDARDARIISGNARMRIQIPKGEDFMPEKKALAPTTGSSRTSK